MNGFRASDLPRGSVVATDAEVFIKTDVDDAGEWYKTCSDDLWWNGEVQSYLDRGAQVLRVGDGSDR